MKDWTVAYMRWAKRFPQVRYNLAQSGMPALDVLAEGLIDEQPNFLGSPAEHNVDRYPRLQAAIAAWTGARPEGVLTGLGTSGINLLALRAMVEAGDRVLVETPVYEPLRKLPELLGCLVQRIPRDAFSTESLPLDRLRDEARKGAKAAVLSNLYNPGGNRLSEAELSGLVEIIEETGLQVLMDEVYMPFCPAGQRELSFLKHPGIATTLSLTKAWGLNTLRAGILLSQDADFVSRADRINDLVNVVAPFVTENAMRQVIEEPERLDAILDPVRPRMEANWQRLSSWADHTGLGRLSLRSAGLCCQFEVRGRPDLADTCRRLEEEHSLLVVDGAFFEAPGSLRIGLGAPEADFAEALELLGAELGRLVP